MPADASDLSVMNCAIRVAMLLPANTDLRGAIEDYEVSYASSYLQSVACANVWFPYFPSLHNPRWDLSRIHVCFAVSKSESSSPRTSFVSQKRYLRREEQLQRGEDSSGRQGVFEARGHHTLLWRTLHKY